MPYLRNREGDLNLWLLLPILRQHRYKFVGTPAVVTGDKALACELAPVIASRLGYIIAATMESGFTLRRSMFAVDD